MKSRDVAELNSHVVYLRSLGYRLAREQGLAPREYELLLAVKALPADTPRGIGELAAWLSMQHHGVVELATRLQRRGLLRRYRDQRDGRQARLALTAFGARVLRELVAREQSHLRASASPLVSTLRRVVGQLPVNGGNGHAGRANGNGRNHGW